MRILMVNKFLYPKGGAETYIIDIGKKLEEMGHQVEYFGMAHEKNILTNSSNLYVSEKDFHKVSPEIFLYPFSIIYSKEAYRKIKTVIHDFKPDVIHLNNFNYQLTPSVIVAAHEENVPVVFTAHDAQLLCPSHMLYVPLKNEQCFKCIHNSVPKSLIGTIEGIKYKNNDVYNHISAIVAPSLFMKRVYEEDERFKGKVTHIRNYINPAISYPVSEEKNDYVLYFGRLAVEKGISLLIDAAEMLPNVRFFFAGNNELGPKDKEKLKAAKNIDYVGFQRGENLASLISSARLCVYPSLWPENCPLSVLEAQKLGTPVLVSEVGGMKELSSEEFTIKDLRAAGIASAIENLINDKEKLKQLKEVGDRNLAETPDINEYTERLLKVYEKAINKE